MRNASPGTALSQQTPKSAQELTMSDSVILTGCTALSQAESFLNRTVDIVGVITDFRPPLPSRGEDWTISFTVCDRSRPHPESGFPVRIFKPTLELLPQIRSEGDIILLRSVKIMSFGKIVAISSYSTSWIISHAPSRPNAPPMITSQPKTTKPKPFELEHIRYLRSWWSTQEAAAAPRNGLATSHQTVSGSSHKRRFSLIKDMDFDCFYDIVGLVVKTFPGMGNYTVYITDFTMNPKLYAYEWNKGGGDYDYRNGRKWPGPWGQYTLQITLWDIHAVAAKQSVFDGAYLKLHNVRAKRNGDGRLEGALHGDRRFTDRVDLQVLKNMDDPRIQELLRRNKEYTRRFENDKTRLEQEIQVNPVDTGKREEEKQARKDEVNKNIRCQKPNHPITPISEILKPTNTTTPFVNRNYRIYCRVIDYLPKNLADFSVPNDPTGTQQERGYENTTKPWIWRFALLVQGTDGAQMRVIVEGEDAVYLLKIDAVDLRKSTHTLQALREKLFLLWGSLEERTVERQLKQKQKPDRPNAAPDQDQPRKRNKSSRKSNAKRHKYDESGKPLRSGDIDPDSDTEDTADEEAEEEQQRGKMFEACIKEYGVSVAGGWKRLHKLFGTVIL